VNKNSLKALPGFLEKKLIQTTFAEQQQQGNVIG